MDKAREKASLTKRARTEAIRTGFTSTVKCLRPDTSEWLLKEAPNGVLAALSQALTGLSPLPDEPEVKQQRPPHPCIDCGRHLLGYQRRCAACKDQRIVDHSLARAERKRARHHRVLDISGSRYPEWAEFCAQHDLSALSECTRKGWLSGKSRPTLPGTRMAAVLFGITEREVIAAAGHGQWDTIEQKKNADWELFKLSDRYKREKSDKKKRAREAVRRRAAQGMCSYRVMVRLGLISDDERKARALERSRRGHERARERGYTPPKQHARQHGVWSAKRIRYEIQLVKRKLRDLERGLSKKWQPWHAHGFWSSDAWVAAGSAQAREWQLKDWQVKTHRRRAREAEAGGGGMTTGEWYEVMKAWGYSCAYCGRRRSQVRDLSRRMDLEVEHVVPMPLGPNARCNIVPACKACNSSKGNRDVLKWAESKGLTLNPRVVEIHRLVLAHKQQLVHT